MKKRKELDALIGNRTKRDNQVAGNRQADYDSLNSSLSSPTADTYMPPTGSYYSASKRVSRSSGKGCGCTLRRMIRICLPVCFLSLVAACITACIGIVWMQVQLKTDVERLKDKITKLEAWQSEQPSALSDMNKRISVVESDIGTVNNGEDGVKSLANRVAVLTENFEEKVEAPGKKIDSLQLQYDNLKTDVDTLKLSEKTLNSKSETIDTAQGLLSASYNELKTAVDSIKTEMSDANVKQLKDIASSKQNAENSISRINATLQRMASNLTSLEVEVAVLEKHTANDIGGVQQDIIGLKQSKSEQENSLSNISREILNVKTQISQVMSNLRGGSLSSKTAGTKQKQLIQRETAHATFQTDHLKRPTLFDLATDLVKKFENLDTNSDGMLSLNELTTKYGDKLANSLLQQDTNHDGVLSKSEISLILSNSQPSTAQMKERKR